MSPSFEPGIWFIWVLLHPGVSDELAPLPGSFPSNYACALETARMAGRSDDPAQLICLNVNTLAPTWWRRL